MKKQAVLSVLLIFMFALLLITAGLLVTEQGVQDVSGQPEPFESLRLMRGEDDGWVLVFAGSSWRLPRRPW